MTADLDARLRNALADAATTTNVSDGAFAAIIERGDSATVARRPTRWILAAGVAAVLAAAVIVATVDRGSRPSTVAMIQMPAIIDSADDCGSVTSRPATPDETAPVAQLPSVLPDGYALIDLPAAFLQERAASSIECWNSDVTYIDSATGRLLTVAVNRQGNDVQADCQLPDDYLPAKCVTIGDRPGAITNEGTRATVSWITANENFAYLSAYGLTTAEILDAANSVVFDGTTISVRAPAGMQQIENSPSTRTDGRDIIYYGATFGNGDTAAKVSLSITTWNDISVNEVGPATVVDLDGATAVVVTTGGPGIGITNWTNSVEAVEQPTGAYITWNREGLTFRLGGPDPEIITFIALQLVAG